MKRTVFRLALVPLVLGLAGCGPPRTPTDAVEISAAATPVPSPSRVVGLSLDETLVQSAEAPEAASPPPATSKAARLSSEETPAQSADVSEDTVQLPAPNRVGSLSLEEALAQRRSVREFDPAPLTAAELGQLLWAAQGITHERGYRTAPSAGALYPLEIYVATEEAVFHYDPQEHSVTVVSRDDVRTALYEVAGRQAAIRQAPAVFIVTAVFERTAAKYGPARSPRYVHLEAGHASQNLVLQSVALGLGAVTIGAFDDEGVQRVLGLPSDHEPLYLIPVGNPKGAGG
jgi:SagB-type dehydrogenase family enzyme